MKTTIKKINRGLTAIGCGLIMIVLALAPFSYAMAYSETKSGDRAVEIAKRARDRVERNGKSLKASSHTLFKEFAERTVELQKLIDTRQRLDKAGFLAKGDPEGDARRAHINAKILVEVGELKKVTDKHLASLLSSLQSFDDAVTGSLVDCQATRSINSNYELTLDQYLKQEKKHYEQASEDAQTALAEYQDTDNPKLKARFLKKYNRAKKRLMRISQRRQLYQARIKVAEMNQKISGIIREKIREEGSDISSRFRQVMADLYNTYSKIIPIAEVGGTGTPEILANLGFNNIEELRETLDIVDGAIGKLGVVLDDMVDEVLAGLGEIKVVKDGSVATESFSIEEEMEFLSKQREAWNSQRLNHAKALFRHDFGLQISDSRFKQQSNPIELETHSAQDGIDGWALIRKGDEQCLKQLETVEGLLYWQGFLSSCRVSGQRQAHSMNIIPAPQQKH